MGERKFLRMAGGMTWGWVEVLEEEWMQGCFIANSGITLSVETIQLVNGQKTTGQFRKLINRFVLPLSKMPNV